MTALRTISAKLDRTIDDTGVFHMNRSPYAIAMIVCTKRESARKRQKNTRKHTRFLKIVNRGIEINSRLATEQVHDVLAE